ncbi:hypothetical protein [Nocardioides sp. GY 10127]|uniref:hypothetical protein n=1 Tax=Nocardioides sp. GY 10127 TaxID=2569762 RepID=UPI0010A78417|nr:hypothetical protein [Nocardioides sp. GY 10127]TIC85450.1 hypothetical protein E8D37_02075 [Nocardioides sp. GY 10127]
MHVVLLVGPQAVGKMSVGRRLCARTGYRLHHNHAAIEALLETFRWDEPAFGRLKDEIRRRVVEEAVAADLPGLVLTFVWAFDVPGDAEVARAMLAPAVDAGVRVDVVELWADEATRLTREGTAERLEAKASKRDQEFARQDLVQSGRRHRLSTDAEHPLPLDLPHLRLDTSALTADQAAALICERLGLVTSGATPPPRAGARSERPGVDQSE